MDPEKRRRLEEAGFRVTTVAEFLGLTPEEEAAVERALDGRETEIMEGDALDVLDLTTEEASALATGLTDAGEILRRRLAADDPDWEANLARARREADREQFLYDAVSWALMLGGAALCWWGFSRRFR